MRSEQVEVMLKKIGVKFRHRQSLSLSEIDDAESHRNQARLYGPPVDEELVIRYGTAYEAGEDLPAVVCYKPRGADHYIILDGNNRVAGARLAGLEGLPAYEVEDPSPLQISLITYEANTRHGKPTSNPERVQHALHLVGMGMKQKDAAKVVGIADNRLGRALAERTLLERIGPRVKNLKKLPPTAQQRIASIPSDEVAARVANLAIDQKMRVDDVAELVKELRTKRSERAQMAYVAERSAQLDQVKSATAGGLVDVPQAVKGVEKAFAALMAIDPDAVRATKVDTKIKNVLRERCQEAMRRVLEIAEAL